MQFRSSCAPSFRKEVVAKGYGFHTPQDGSVCRIRIVRDPRGVLDTAPGSERELIVGDVDEPLERIVEDCIRTMKEEEECTLTFRNPHDLPPDKTEERTDEQSSEEEASLVEIQFQLVSYTREPEIWEMSVTEKWRRASYHKQKGLELYSRGAYQYAFRRFGLTLKYVVSLEHDIPPGQEEEGMDMRGLKLSCYLNVAACQMRHRNFEAVAANATQALRLQPRSAKALYRRGAALLQLQEYERAGEDLAAAQALEPRNQAVAKQLQLLRAQVHKLNQYYASAMKKLFL